MFEDENIVFTNPASLPAHCIRKTFHMPDQMKKECGGEVVHEMAEGSYFANSFYGGQVVPVQGEFAQQSMMPSLPPLELSNSEFSIELPENDNRENYSKPADGEQELDGEEELLEPLDENGKVPHFSRRRHIPLATDEDVNWLSEFQTYCRAEFLDIFWATAEDVENRNTSRKVTLKQMGIRCRFCAHLEHNLRARRASAFPSSTSQIYQSFNMMIRDHYPNCQEVPSVKMEVFHKLKSRNNQGAADSKKYWRHAAEKIGITCCHPGIYMDETTREAALAILPFSVTRETLEALHHPVVYLVDQEDKEVISPFLFALMSCIQRVFLLEVECRSTRKNLKAGLPGFGCRFCYQAARMGFSRIFPTKRKGLPDKVKNMNEHLKRCSLCPKEIKDLLRENQHKKKKSVASSERLFFDRIWKKLNDFE